MGIAIIGLIILLILIILVFKQYNILTDLRLKVEQSKSGIDIYLQQRFDLIPALVNTVKGYMNYEKEMLESITKLRSQYYETKNIKVSEQLNSQLNKILLVAENYPELKSSEQFLNLQKNLSKMESQLQAARRLYNNDVTKYNTKLNIVPYNIIAMIFGFKEEDLFKTTKKGKLTAKTNQ